MKLFSFDWFWRWLEGVPDSPETGFIPFSSGTSLFDRCENIAGRTGREEAQHALKDAVEVWDSITTHMRNGVDFLAVLPSGETIEVEFPVYPTTDSGPPRSGNHLVLVVNNDHD